MSGLLVYDVTLVTAGSAREGALRVEGESVAELLPPLDAKQARAEAARHGAQLVDGGGRWLLPGGVDPHVHLALPTAGTTTIDDFESGSRAALAGGTTTLVDFVTPARGQPLPEAARARLAEARGSFCDHGLHASVTRWTSSTADELAVCVEEMGLRSVKTYLAYLDTIGLGEDDLLRVMEVAARLDAPVLVHCEDGVDIERRQDDLVSAGETGPRAHARSRPPECEAAAVRRALSLSEETGARLYVVHVSTLEAARELEQARARGLGVLTETCPHYLLLDESRYEAPDDQAVAFVMTPPLRPSGHPPALREALARGVFDVVATDHCSFDLAQKQAAGGDFLRIPNGVAGVEHRLALLYTLGVRGGLLSPSDWVRLVCEGPARAFGLYPRKGSLRVGSDADLVLWDPTHERLLRGAEDHHRCDHSVYEGMRVGGRADVVWRRGERVVEDGEPLPALLPGRYLPR